MASDQTVAHVQENTEINRSAGEVVSGPYHNVSLRRVLDVRLTAGLNASIATLIAVFISDMFFSDQVEV
ncbi:unnamed protein product [Penicillium salamii]|uniref:Uncharacterized protein n=1 Tax=Penicillium salamii TaxID=1612424 RepID=A0A9W4N3T4_9EURO|nr:unnamed protein product [Penicillium salamii]